MLNKEKRKLQNEQNSRRDGEEERKQFEGLSNVLESVRANPADYRV